MPKKIDVIIYFEHIARELDACIILKKRLEQLGLRAEIVPIHYNRYWTFIKYWPKVVVVPFFFADNNDIIYQEFKNQYGDVALLNLHHEQLYNEMTKSHFMPKNEITKNAYHLAWGENFSNDLIETGVNPNHITICGNPRTDNYFRCSNDWIKKKYGIEKDIIFIPTSFSWAFVEEDYFIKNAKLDPKEFKKKKDLTIHTAKIFLHSIRRLARKFKDKIFIVRPHPFEKIDTYQKFMYDLDGIAVEDNIKIVRDGNIYDWIKASSVVIGWMTTVSVEASIFQKKNIIYTPIPLDDNTKTDFMKKHNHIVTEYDELESLILDPTSIPDINSQLFQELTDSMGKADGLVNKRLAEFIKSIIPEKQSNQINIKPYYKNLFKTIIIDFPKDTLKNLGLLTQIRPIYSGVLEDMISYKRISKLINQDFR